jgi:signal transduction histidine kinase
VVVCAGAGRSGRDTGRIVIAPAGGTGAASATTRLDRTMSGAVGASRIFALVQTVGITRSIRTRVPHPRVLAVGVAGLGAQSVWAAWRGLQRGSIRDRTIASSDAVTQCVALVVEAASWGSRIIPSDARWSETFGAVVTSWLGFEDPSPATTGAALAGWLGTYALTTGGRAPAESAATGTRVNEANSHAALTMAGRALGRQLVAQASELDDARADAITQAQRLAAAHERRHQHRVIHDSALQILEAIAGGWELDDDLLVARLDYEIARLRGLLEAPGSATTDLAGGLAALVVRFSRDGLAVDLDDTSLDRSARSAGAEALISATHEALTNVAKHAGVGRAHVHATSTASEIVIRVTDTGQGFDPAQPRAGFGLDESIRGRMRDVGGGTTVTSSPGRGTVIELRTAR